MAAVSKQPPHRNEDSGRSTETLAWALHHLAVATAALDTAIAREVGLSSTDYLAMKHLLIADEPLGPIDLARLLGMSTGSTTTLIDRLQQAGHVERRPHPGDRRRLTLHPTSASTTAITSALQPLGAEVDHLSGQFTPGETDAIHRFLTAATTIHTDHRAPDSDRAYPAGPPASH